jgi:hypothetical protein
VSVRWVGASAARCQPLAAKTLTDKPTARAHAYGLLHAICGTAVEDELIAKNPCAIKDPLVRAAPISSVVARSVRRTAARFERGGWTTPHFDNETVTCLNQIYQRADAFLFGRRTYEIFAGSWEPRQIRVSTPSQASQTVDHRHSFGERFRAFARCAD